MGEWRALALDSVRYGVVANELREIGFDWSTCAHIPATSSLAKAVRQTKVGALPIATVIDMIVMAGNDPRLGVPISSFPSFDDIEDDNYLLYQRRIRSWQNKVAGKRIWMSIEYQQHLKDFLEKRGFPRGLQRVFIESRREFIKTMQTLIAAGLRPETLKPTEKIAQIATSAWIELEKSFPSVYASRDDLWMDQDEFSRGETSRSKNLRARIYESLDQAFGKVDGPRTIVYHGYYFFTPPQWAFFQLLRSLPDVNQIFIVHDDGQSSVYETWRRYFDEKWEMPKPEVRAHSRKISYAACALKDSLRGERIDIESLIGRLEIHEYRTPTQFVKHWMSERSAAQQLGQNEPQTFAASASDISRYLERFGGVSQTGEVNLALLPLGAYLLGIHNCIQLDPQGLISIELNGESLVDIVASGYLMINPEKGIGFQNSGVLQRVLPFFSDCKIGHDWIERAEALLRLVIVEVKPLGERSSIDNDVARMSTAALNPLRLAPWVDITVDDADAILKAIQTTVGLAQTIASGERVSLKQHIIFLKANLKRGMANLPVEVRARIEEKIDGMSVAIDAEVSADSLIDIVNLLLGVSADFSVTGEDERDLRVGELRGLDALGLKKLDASLHIANLTDVSFPSRVSSVGWPYRIEDLISASVDLPMVSIEILQTRVETAAMSDLYLLSLGLDGVEDGHLTTLSYISKIGREISNPSPILALLAVPGHRPTAAIVTRAGGLVIKKIDNGHESNQLRERRDHGGFNARQTELDDAANRVPVIAGASAIVCPRRFALQWALGPSASYMSEHHHLMLYGNLINAIQRLRRRVDPARAQRICSDLWRHYTPGQRSSSEAKARVVSDRLSASMPWVFTLGGAKTRNDSISESYKAAMGDERQPALVLSPAGASFLPSAHVSSDDLCNSCPVKPRCAMWFKPDNH